MKNLYIPKPCSENWESMSPQEKGRFCSVCSKCVIDFTQKKTEEIQQIIEEKKDEQVCGRFYDYQLKDSDSSERLKSRSFRYIPSGFQNNRLVLSIFSALLFLTGCSKPKPEVYATTGMVVEIEEDSAVPANNNYTIGKPAVINNDTVAKISKKDCTIVSKKHSNK